MSTAEQVLAVARSQIGTVEDTQGRQKYGAFYGMNGVAWCAEFQWWCFSQAGAAGLVPKTAYTPTFYQWFVGRNQASRTAKVGSLVFYNWPDSVNRIQHVGIVESIPAPGQIITIEGNTTSGTVGNQSSGGGVWRRRRATTSVVGYGHPLYMPSPTPSPAPAPAPAAPTLAALEDDLMASITITPDVGGRFHHSGGAEAGGGSAVASRGYVVFGSTYGGTTWTVAALGADGKVLGYWKDQRTGNNTSLAQELPAGTRAVTTEGLVDNAGTRPWCSTYCLR